MAYFPAAAGVYRDPDGCAAVARQPAPGPLLKLLPAILLYMAYLTILISARGSLEKGKLSPTLGLWWVHGIFLVIGLGLLYWEPIRLKMKSRRGQKEMARG